MLISQFASWRINLKDVFLISCTFSSHGCLFFFFKHGSVCMHVCECMYVCVSPCISRPMHLVLRTHPLLPGEIELYAVLGHTTMQTHTQTWNTLKHSGSTPTTPSTAWTLPPSLTFPHLIKHHFTTPLPLKQSLHHLSSPFLPPPLI